MKYIYDSPLGNIKIESKNGKIVGLDFTAELLENKEESDEVINCCILELDEYFAGKRKGFTVPLDLQITPFRKKVLEELIKIPYGETVSYKDIALKIGNENASRAVGGANHSNPIAIIIPCHRVIGKNGNLTGYAGGIDKKEKLLELERKFNI